MFVSYNYDENGNMTSGVYDEELENTYSEVLVDEGDFEAAEDDARATEQLFFDEYGPLTRGGEMFDIVVGDDEPPADEIDSRLFGFLTDRYPEMAPCAPCGGYNG